MRVCVTVMPKKEILDVQGRAIESTLGAHNLNVDACRVGKLIELDIEGSAETVMAKAKKIAEFVLHNPLIEQYEIELK